jgi:hypothetical protein
MSLLAPFRERTGLAAGHAATYEVEVFACYARGFRPQSVKSNMKRSQSIIQLMLVTLAIAMLLACLTKRVYISWFTILGNMAVCSTSVCFLAIQNRKNCNRTIACNYYINTIGYIIVCLVLTFSTIGVCAIAFIVAGFIVGMALNSGSSHPPDVFFPRMLAGVALSILVASRLREVIWPRLVSALNAPCHYSRLWPVALVLLLGLTTMGVQLYDRWSYCRVMIAYHQKQQHRTTDGYSVLIHQQRERWFRQIIWRPWISVN